MNNNRKMGKSERPGETQIEILKNTWAENAASDLQDYRPHSCLDNCEQIQMHYVYVPLI